jgi:hypothetical protein
MKEDFLQVLWQNQYLDRSKSWNCNQGPVQVIKPGFRNRSKAGPDFEQANLRIDGMDWVGSVEIHVKASEWNLHGHEKDPAYNSVILHVVWENDQQTFREDGSPIPTLEIKNLVPLSVILKYRQLIENQSPQIPCAHLLNLSNNLTQISMQEKALVERLERKAAIILDRLQANEKNWMETFYQTIAWNLGLKVNSEPMLRMAQCISVKTLASQGWKLDTLLPIFLGLARFLPDSDSIPTQQFRFFQKKYSLQVPILKWEKFRIRESAWPHHRVILLAGIAAQLPAWFHNLTEIEKPEDFFSGIDPIIYPEWVMENLKNQNLSLSGLEMTPFLKDSLVINSFAPMLTAMGIYTGRKELTERALEWLSVLKSEKNTLVKQWDALGIKSTSAAQSQGLIEIHNEYCKARRCMECRIGVAILEK